MGFREVLCVSAAAALGIWGLAFLMINIQRDSHLEPRPALLRFGFIYIYFFFLFDFFASLLPLSLCLILSACGIFLIQGVAYLSYMLICIALHDLRGMWLQRNPE